MAVVMPGEGQLDLYDDSVLSSAPTPSRADEHHEHGQSSPAGAGSHQPDHLLDIVHEQLDEASKLEVLLEDPRTGFIPAQHREKTAALTVLAFLSDESQHPGGIHDHLAEVFQRHKTIAREHGHSLAAGAIKGGIAVQSILYEFADYFNDAARSYQQLDTLAKRINACDNPNISLKQELSDSYDDDRTGVSELVRTLDGLAMVQEATRGTESATAFDRLAVKIERFEKPQNGKNKIVGDMYTAEPHDPIIDEHIESMIDQLSIGELRALIATVLQMTHNRGVFWSRVLRARYYEYQHKADNALAATSLNR